MAAVNQRRHDGHEWHDAMLGAESMRPVRRGDDLQAGSNWAEPARRHYTPASVSEAREMRRGVIFIVVIIALIGLAGGFAS